MPWAVRRQHRAASTRTSVLHGGILCRPKHSRRNGFECGRRAPVVGADRQMADEDTVVFANGLPAIPEKLLLARYRGDVLFVTGAGISRPAPSSLPDFRELVIRVY